MVDSSSRITLENNGKIRRQPDRENAFARASGGGSGIRTHGDIAATPVFKTGALNRSAIPPVPFAGMREDACVFKWQRRAEGAAVRHKIAPIGTHSFNDMESVRPGRGLDPVDLCLFNVF